MSRDIFCNAKFQTVILNFYWAAVFFLVII